MIEPDFFGCSGKLPYDQTRRLASAVGDGSGGSDFSEFECEGVMVSSIDRIHRCARDWGQFARIALNHAFGDVLCAGASPVQAMLSFEFGIDAQEGDHASCSAAFMRELDVRGVSLGKCHSGRGIGVTAVTIAVLAVGPRRQSPKLKQGSLYLSRPVGAFKLHYLSEMGIASDAPEACDPLQRPHNGFFHVAQWELVTDVSGHGLLGAVAQVAWMYGVDIDLSLSHRHAYSADVLDVPVECLQNPVDSYGLSLATYDPDAVTLATLRETAGPFVAFLEDETSKAELPATGIPVGRYSVGKGRIDLAWRG